MKPALKSFVDEILAINPSMIRSGSTGFDVPIGSATASNTITRLQSQVAVFAQLYQADESKRLLQVAREIEGLLYLCQTLNILSEEKAIHLARHIHVLLDEHGAAGRAKAVDR